MTYLNIFFREHGASVSMLFDTEAEARQELRLRAGDMTITGRNAGKIVWDSGYTRATWSIETSEPF